MRVRAASGEDLAAIAALFASVEEAVNGRPSRLDADAVEGWMQGVSFPTNTWLLEEDGELVAGAFATLLGTRGTFAGAVRPSAQGRGAGTRLVELAEARLREEGAERIHGWTLSGDAAADDLFHGRGYHEVRRFFEMAIELDEEPPAPAVRVDPFREEDAPAFHDTLEEAFADHWEHHAEPFDSWWSRQRRRAAYDASLWFLVRDHDEIVAVVRNEENRMQGGFVAALGVRRAWRGHGHGRALLLHSLRELRRRGLPRATLSVDGANPTGAVRLYESVGMRVEQENVVWERLGAGPPPDA